MSMTDWLEAEEAAAMLGKSPRQVLRYAAARRVRTRQQGRRQQYHAGDVEQLAAELAEAERARPANVAPEVGRALVEVVQAQRQVIALQAEVMALRQQVQLLEQQRQAYIRIIGELRRRAR